MSFVFHSFADGMRINAIRGKDDEMEENVEMQTPMLLIRIPRTYSEDMGSLFLYEAMRGFWRVNQAKVDDVDKWPYAAAVFNGKIIQVYSIAKWEKAKDAVMLTRVPNEAEKERYVFTGTVAPKEIRDMFVGKSCADCFKKGDRSPVRYVELSDEGE